MFVIGEAVIDETVGNASFCCDLNACRGACCCIEGVRGAPLEDDEVLEIKKAFHVVRHYLGEENISEIERSGMYEGRPGDFATTSVNGRECVFVYFDHGTAKCSFERAYNEGKLDWRKPLSCHLFPIRIKSSRPDVIRYERIQECSGGEKRGELENVKLVNFLREALTRKYGEEWYATFRDYCKRTQGV